MESMTIRAGNLPFSLATARTASRTQLGLLGTHQLTVLLCCDPSGVLESVGVYGSTVDQMRTVRIQRSERSRGNHQSRGDARQAGGGETAGDDDGTPGGAAKEYGPPNIPPKR